MSVILYRVYFGINNAKAEEEWISPFSTADMAYKKKSSISAVPALIKFGQLYSAYMPFSPDILIADNISFSFCAYC